MARMARVQRSIQRRFHAADERSPRQHGARRPSGHSSFFLPGATIPESGIYEVLHEDDHRAAHESVMVKGDQFPFCDTCEDRVRFRVVRTAPYIFDDEDFVE